MSVLNIDYHSSFYGSEEDKGLLFLSSFGFGSIVSDFTTGSPTLSVSSSSSSKYSLSVT